MNENYPVKKPDFFIEYHLINFKFTRFFSNFCPYFFPVGVYRSLFLLTTIHSLVLIQSLHSPSLYLAALLGRQIFHDQLLVFCILYI